MSSLDLLARFIDFVIVTTLGKTKEELASERSEYDKILRDNAVTCKKCNELALPITGTSNNYKCSGCGVQFRGAIHKL